MGIRLFSEHFCQDFFVGLALRPSDRHLFQLSVYCHSRVTTEVKEKSLSSKSDRCVRRVTCTAIPRGLQGRQTGVSHCTEGESYSLPRRQSWQREKERERPQTEERQKTRRTVYREPVRQRTVKRTRSGEVVWTACLGPNIQAWAHS